jgi:hypothetical protein
MRMDYRPFELANAQCKPKHFGPPTALQRRLAYEAAYRPPADLARPGILGRLAAWLCRRLRPHA